MAFRIDPLCNMKCQGMNLNCGRYCLEAVMEWVHGTPYGAEPVGDKMLMGVDKVKAHIFGAKRTAHTKEVAQWVKGEKLLMSGNFAFDVDEFKKDYGLFILKDTYHDIGKGPNSDFSGSDFWWTVQLSTYGPLIATVNLKASWGPIGVMGSLGMDGGHYVVIVGINDKSQIEVQDPLHLRNLVPGNKNKPVRTIPVANFNKVIRRMWASYQVKKRRTPQRNLAYKVN